MGEVARRSRLLRPWWSAAGLVAVLLVLVQAGWRGVLLARGFFTQDDYLMLRLGREPMSAELLLQDYSGHLWPGNFVLAWAHARLGPLEWPAFVAEILVLQALAAVLAWLVLCRLLPGSWVRLPLLAAALLCPLSLWPTTWWAAAIGFLPISAMLLLATWALLVHLQDGSRWAPAVVVAATLVGLQFQERALLYPVVLGLVAVAFSPAPGLRAVPDALRARWRLWTALVVVLVAYLAAHRVLAPVDSSTVGSAEGGAELVGNFLFRTAVPGLLGGPWRPTIVGDVLMEPPLWAVLVAWTVLVAAVVWTLRRSRAAGWGWTLLGVYAVVDVGLLFAGRTALGSAIGLVPRYAADLVPVLPIALGLVARAVLAEPARVPRGRSARAPALAALAGVVAYGVSAALTTAVVAPSGYNTADREFVQTLRAQLREQPEAVLVDAVAPDDIMVFWFGSDASVSTLVGLAPERPLFDLPTHDLRIADADGILRPVELVGAEPMEPGPDPVCGYPVSSEPVVVPLQSPVEGQRVVVRVDYFTSASGTLRLEAAGTASAAALREEGTLYVTVESDDDRAAVVDEVELSLVELGDRDVPAAAPGTVCVTGLTAGFATAREE